MFYRPYVRTWSSLGRTSWLKQTMVWYFLIQKRTHNIILIRTFHNSNFCLGPVRVRIMTVRLYSKENAKHNWIRTFVRVPCEFELWGLECIQKRTQTQLECCSNYWLVPQSQTWFTLLSRIKAPALISEYLKIWAFIFFKTCPLKGAGRL